MSAQLAEAVKRDSCPVRRSFIERLEGDENLTPLASLLRTRDAGGGKGGGLRIALLLTLIWVNARPPFSTSRVAPYWAELLGRDDPQGEGARTIRDCLRELEDRGFVQLHTSGQRVHIVLCNESTPRRPDGKPNLYTLPYSEEEPYVPIPRSFWTEGLAGRLSGAGTAMYLCALALTRHDRPDFFISADFFDTRYGISRSSRKRGLAELLDHGVLTMRVVESIDLETFRRVRRNVYKLRRAFRQPAPWTPSEQSTDESNADSKSVDSSAS